VDQQAWDRHLLQRITDLTREVKQLRKKVRYEHVRAETWKQRALRKTLRR
jgi:hypothetical protein